MNEEIQNELQTLKDRNKRVELDKAWETSLARKALLAVLTYLVITSFFLVAGLPKPFLNPIVPTVGYILSTLTLPFAKKIWIKNIKHRKRP